MTVSIKLFMTIEVNLSEFLNHQTLRNKKYYFSIEVLI